MKPTTLLLGSIVLSASLLANPYESSKEELASVVQSGKKASAALLKTLGGNLKKHMKAEGPVGAATFCSTNAFPLTDKVSGDFGKNITLKRISLKPRNPANRPDVREETILTSLHSLKEHNVFLPEYLVEQVDKETYKFYKPLLINKGVCLKCHGDISKIPELETFIVKTYPEDKATGYMMGDLRGAIVVTVKK